MNVGDYCLKIRKACLLRAPLRENREIATGGSFGYIFQVLTDSEGTELNYLKRTWTRISGWWMTFASFLGYVNTIILLTLMYILVIGPSWVVFRVLRKDPLERKRVQPGSFWRAKVPLGHSLDETKHQF
jgi:hypothetical protein